MRCIVNRRSLFEETLKRLRYFIAQVTASPRGLFALASLLILSNLISKSLPHSVPGLFADHFIDLLVFAVWATAGSVLVTLGRLPTLFFYVLLVIFVSFIEASNFGILNTSTLRSWLILIGIAISLELLANQLIRKLSHIVATTFSTTYHLLLISPFVIIYLYNIHFHVPISRYTILALLQTTMFEAREFILSQYPHANPP